VFGQQFHNTIKGQNPDGFEARTGLNMLDPGCDEVGPWGPRQGG